jgi:hypothetical protein
VILTSPVQQSWAEPWKGTYPILEHNIIGLLSSCVFEILDFLKNALRDGFEEIHPLYILFSECDLHSGFTSNMDAFNAYRSDSLLLLSMLPANRNSEYQRQKEAHLSHLDNCYPYSLNLVSTRLWWMWKVEVIILTCLMTLIAFYSFLLLSRYGHRSVFTRRLPLDLGYNNNDSKYKHKVSWDTNIDKAIAVYQ